ncbi:hypothetical protein GGS20DRAFT_533981 [Poronia punctata]|nr:hypothetical protein GGS20DRAFT_533981 [Poronia punctata]
MDTAGRQQERNDLNNAVENGASRNGQVIYTRPSDLDDLQGEDVHIYVSAPCVIVTGPDGSKTCEGGDIDNAPKWQYASIDKLLDKLFGAGTPFEAVPVTKRGYIRPVDREEIDELADTSVLMMMMYDPVVVQYDPNQLTDEFRSYDPKHAAYRVWLESSYYQRDWVASTCQGGNAPSRKRDDDSCPISDGNDGDVTTTSAISTSEISSVVSSVNTTSTPEPESSTPPISSPIPPPPETNGTFIHMSSPLTTLTPVPPITESTPQQTPTLGPDFMTVVTFSTNTVTLIS